MAIGNATKHYVISDLCRMNDSSFAVLAIIVACLGLFALSAFMVEQRNKEISIRLVLGASVKNIFSLLTMNFVKLVMIIPFYCGSCIHAYDAGMAKGICV